jgi:hypothetical protein
VTGWIRSSITRRHASLPEVVRNLSGEMLLFFGIA